MNWTKPVAICAILLSVSACTEFDAGPAPSGPAEFQKGISYASWWEGQYATPGSEQSLRNLAATGADWVAIIVTGYQDTHASTEIRRDPPRTPTEDDVVHAITRAHELGLSVMLKPHVDLGRDPAQWRGQIGVGFQDEAQWRAWFAEYREFIGHYADLARENGVEQFAVGTELAATSHREQDWREVIREVRARFPGPITYASNHSGEETAITWWDAVDYIGVDAYYPLAAAENPTVAELKTAWVDEGYGETLRRLAATYGRPVLLTEIGYRSVAGAAREPWVHAEEPIDLRVQANAYRAALELFWGQPWLAGMYWWYWDTDPQSGGKDHPGYTPYRKPAEQVLRSFYSRRPPQSRRRGGLR